jgi:cysteine sulfinate desulfinase/cysteine desulfurase-like protein
MRKINLDHAASTATHPEIVRAMLPYFTNAFGNAIFLKWKEKDKCSPSA